MSGILPIRDFALKRGTSEPGKGARAELAKFAADAAGGPGAYEDFKQEWDVEKALEFFGD